MTWRCPAAVLGALLALSTTSPAQEGGPSLEELELQYQLDKASQAFDKRDLTIEQLSADFKYRCLRAIGDTRLCACLVAKRPYILRFEQYVGISSRSKTELRYEALSNEGKEIIDRVFKLREACVDGR